MREGEYRIGTLIKVCEPWVTDIKAILSLMLLLHASTTRVNRLSRSFWITIRRFSTGNSNHTETILTHIHSLSLSPSLTLSNLDPHPR